MATLYISYWGHVERNVAGDPIKSETLTTSTTSGLAAAIPAGAVVATVYSPDADHVVTKGSGSPTAAIGAGSFVLPSGAERDILLQHYEGGYKFAARTA